MAHLRPLYTIAYDIHRQWKKPNFGAIPYLDAMFRLTCTQDYYFSDRGDHIVRYFLANATNFKGDVAQELKEELKEHLKAHGGA